MSNEFTDETLAAYVLGELAPEEKERVERALASSAELRERLDGFARAHRLLLEAAREEGAALSEEARNRLLSEAKRHARALGAREAQRRGSRRLRRPKKDPAVASWRPVLLATCAAAAALLLAVLWPGWPGPGGRAAPPPREVAVEPVRTEGGRPVHPEPREPVVTEHAPPPVPAPEPREEAARAPRATPVLPEPEEELAAAPGPAPARARAPAPPETARTVARLEGVAESVYYKRGDSDRWFRASEGIHLAVGDSLDTRMGLAALELEGGGRVCCNKRTWLRFEETKAFLRRGEVYCEFDAGRGCAIATADGLVRHIGTGFSVKVAPSGTTVTVAEGRVEVGNDHDTVEVGEGFQVSVHRGSAPGRPRRTDVRKAVAWVRLRVTSGLVALYHFDEGTGRTVHDVSGEAAPADLVLSGDNFTWAAGGLSFDAPDHNTVATSTVPPGKLCARSTTTGQVTLEAWFSTRSLSQVGPPRILAYEDPLGEAANERNWSVCQSKDEIDFRLRTSRAGAFKHVDLFTTGRALRSTKKACHVVCTYRRGAGMRIYVDGVLKAANDESGTFDVEGANAWGPGCVLSIGNRTTSFDRDWQGVIFLAAVYDRALSRAEIRQNLLAGPNPGLAAAPRNGRP